MFRRSFERWIAAGLVVRWSAEVWKWIVTSFFVLIHAGRSTTNSLRYHVTATGATINHEQTSILSKRIRKAYTNQSLISHTLIRAYLSPLVRLSTTV